MMGLCPECAHVLYGYPNCDHHFQDGRCVNCYWDGSKSVYIKKLNQQVALASGPVIYCIESCDNPNLNQMRIMPETQYAIGKQHQQFRDVNIIQINNNEWSGIAIPYYMVANRDKNSSHKVWLPLK